MSESEFIDTTEMTKPERAVRAVSDLLEATKRAFSEDDWERLSGEAQELSDFFEEIWNECMAEEDES